MINIFLFCRFPCSRNQVRWKANRVPECILQMFIVHVGLFGPSNSSTRHGKINLRDHSCKTKRLDSDRVFAQMRILLATNYENTYNEILLVCRSVKFVLFG